MSFSYIHTGKRSYTLIRILEEPWLKDSRTDLLIFEVNFVLKEYNAEQKLETEGKVYRVPHSKIRMVTWNGCKTSDTLATCRNRLSPS